MRYLIIQPGFEPFLTKWFDFENHFTGTMTVFDLKSGSYTDNGIDWKPIQIDQL